MRVVMIVCVLAGCHASSPGDDKPDTDADADTGTPVATGDDWCAVQGVFTRDCVICHSPAGGNQGSLDLQTDPIGALVSQPSPGYPGRTLVVPTDPDASFLIAKVEGTQGADGALMPPTGSLTGGELATLRDWVAAGANSVCDGTTGPGPDPFHPAGWADPGDHGMAAKLQDLDCLQCHGADLDGGSSAVSCDSCHVAGWRTDCTYCHGGEQNGTGAPPENIDDSTDPGGLPTFPAHDLHVTETIHPAWDCDVCHTTPTDPLSPGHLFVDDLTPGVAEVAYAGGTYTAGTCANMYCHGDGQTPGTADASFVSSCSACHPSWSSSEGAIQGMSGEHHKHVWDEGFDCSECHAQTVNAAHAIVDPLVHVDGTPTVDPSANGVTWNAGAGTCNGTCHGEFHLARRW
jgi:predicted CxxxxCH...CXXCH cytochrome family protein